MRLKMIPMTKLRT